MRFVLASARKDLRRIRRDPVSILIWVGIPLMVSLILSVVFGGGSVAPQGKLLVTDGDESFLSNLLLGAFNREPLSKMLLVEKVKPEDGRRRMDHGAASAFLIIPPGFGRAFLRKEPTQLELITNPSQRVLPSIVEETLSILLEGSFYLQLMLSDQLQGFDERPSTDQVVAQIGVIIRRLEKVRHYLDPPLIVLESRVTEKRTAGRTSFAVAFFPGMLLLSLLFVAGGMGGDVWKERAQGTLRRLATTPGRLEAFLAGKLCAVSGVLLVIAVAAVLGGHWLLGIGRGNLPAAALWVVASGLTLYLMMLLLQVTASSEKAAHVFTNLVTLPLAMIGGSFFPFEDMPGWMAAIGRWTPNGWAIVQLKAILEGTAQPARVAAAFGGLALVGALCFLLVLRRVRRAFLS